ncbi:efflux RND transporter periplasmic adaptor subunit [Jannaschia seohaensis]|uniref:RND family efflux transporter MFP subunit n=1 Tax=Jannaschia seohaensis TaxID=475081 RepID=A0A2Y9AY36_9RHOB|nr:efflux RND transporter periplasmic adaptor subunit [Jannaschia seohaensis]PWJ17394.1 RND family efflux transporter MFP subunit [Jannaschia seohaensis]SSA47457.1 RND family efflux transporter, MFP subunit [Jannaschia seohaensis]
MTMRLHIIGVAIALGLGLGLTSAVQAQRGPAAVGVETVEFRPFAETVPVFAEVVAARNGTVAARVSGSVATVEVAEGELIEAGAPIVRLDRELLSILLSRAEAEVAVARAGLEGGRVRADTARTAFERIEALRDTSAFSDSRFDDARGQLLEAESRIAEAEARLAVAQAVRAEAEYNLDRTTILAPFDGTVLEVLVTPGEVLPIGAPVVRLLDTSTLEIEAAVPSQYVDLLEPGMTVTARAEDGVAFEVAVRALVPIETAATRTRPVRFASPELAQARTTALGQSITVLIPVGAARDLLTVPKDALVQARGGWTVFAVVDGVAQPRTVEIGLAADDRFEVVSGLAEGDIVVVRGNERLRPGQEVQAMGQGNGPPGGGQARQAASN